MSIQTTRRRATAPDLLELNRTLMPFKLLGSQREQVDQSRGRKVWLHQFAVAGERECGLQLAIDECEQRGPG